jgi:hypothetical protein
MAALVIKNVQNSDRMLSARGPPGWSADCHSEQPARSPAGDRHMSAGGRIGHHEVAVARSGTANQSRANITILLDGAQPVTGREQAPGRSYAVST